MKKLFVMLVLVFSLAACLPPIPTAPKLEDVQLPIVGEETVWNSADYKGKPVFVVFMGSWCPYCQMTMPAVTAVAEEFGDQVEIVGIFMDNDAENVKIVAKEHGLTVKTLYDGGDVAQSLGVNGLPHAIVFDKNHKLVRVWEGFKPTLADEYREALRKVTK